MSATSGTGDSATRAANAAVDASSGQDTRTISAPASASSPIWRAVAATSEVTVLVMDWTETGASAPTSTRPTLIS